MSRTQHERQARKNPDRPEKYVSISTSKACRKEYLGKIARHKEKAARFDEGSQIESAGLEETERQRTFVQEAAVASTPMPSIEAVLATPKAVFFGHLNALEDSIDRLRRLRFEIQSAGDRRHVVIYRIVAEANVHLGFGWDGSRAIREIYYTTSEMQSDAA